MTTKKETKKIALMVFGNDLHVSVTMLTGRLGNEHIVEIVKKAVKAFETEPADKKIVVRFWDVVEDIPLLSFEWHMHQHSHSLHYCWEREGSFDACTYSEHRKKAWDIVDAIGYALELAEAPHDPLYRNHYQELRSSNETVERLIRREFGGQLSN